MEKPVIIYDTDMDTDCDDAGALGILLSYVNAGKAEMLGIIADAPVPEAAPCCEAICRWYGVECLIGAAQAERYREDPRFSEYRAHRARLPEKACYNRVLAQTVGKTDRDYISAGRAYRQMLTQADDGSVTIVCVGLLTGLVELLESEGDEISPLNGVELCRRKVKRVVSMTTVEYPRYEKPNFNYMMDAVGANQALKMCPVPIYASPEGTQVITGYSFMETLPENHPLRTAYTLFVGHLFGKANAGRSSWDLVATLYALEEESPLFAVEKHGKLHYETDGTAWWAENGREDGLVSITVSCEDMAKHLEKLMVEGI